MEKPKTNKTVDQSLLKTEMKQLIQLTKNNMPYFGSPLYYSLLRQANVYRNSVYTMCMSIVLSLKPIYVQACYLIHTHKSFSPEWQGLLCYYCLVYAHRYIILFFVWF